MVISIQENGGGSPNPDVNNLLHHSQEDSGCTRSKGFDSFWAKGLNTCDHVIFQFFLIYKFAKIATFLFFSGGVLSHIHEK